MKLYEIKKEYDELLSLLDDADEQEEKNIMHQLHALEWERSEKLENIAKYMQRLDGQMDVLDKEIARLNSLKKTHERKKDSLKKYVCFNLISDWIMKMDTDLFRFSFRNSQSVEVIDEESIPQEYIKEKVTTSIDKVAIKKAIKEWKDVQGAVINEKQNLQIK